MQPSWRATIPSHSIPCCSPPPTSRLSPFDSMSAAAAGSSVVPAISVSVAHCYSSSIVCWPKAKNCSACIASETAKCYKNSVCEGVWGVCSCSCSCCTSCKPACHKLQHPEQLSLPRQLCSFAAWLPFRLLHFDQVPGTTPWLTAQHITESVICRKVDYFQYRRHLNNVLSHSYVQ